MVIVSVLYLLVIYLVFHKFKLLPWNTASKLIALIIGVIILSGFLVGLQGLTPSSTQAVISGYVTEIAPQVSGRVVEGPAEPNVELDPGSVLYRSAAQGELRRRAGADRGYARPARADHAPSRSSGDPGRHGCRLDLRGRAVSVAAGAAHGSAGGQPGQ